MQGVQGNCLINQHQAVVELLSCALHIKVVGSVESCAVCVIASSGALYAATTRVCSSGLEKIQSNVSVPIHILYGDCDIASCQVSHT